jgi:hypothetical protein
LIECQAELVVARKVVRAASKGYPLFVAAINVQPQLVVPVVHNAHHLDEVKIVNAIVIGIEIKAE